jgi:hypothetical protein
MRALEAPVAAFHGGGTLAIGSARGKGRTGATLTSASSSDPNVTLHPPASPYSVITGTSRFSTDALKIVATLVGYSAWLQR